MKIIYIFQSVMENFYIYLNINEHHRNQNFTVKCYLSLTQAIRFYYGGNPYVPKVTGKTDSVKALNQAFGRQVLVFNCDEGIDFKAMVRNIIGLVKRVFGGIFDEFNRLLKNN